MSLFGTKPPDVNRRRFLERSLAVGAATAGTHFLSTASLAADPRTNYRPISGHHFDRSLRAS